MMLMIEERMLHVLVDPAIATDIADEGGGRSAKTRRLAPKAIAPQT
jgi:hypothetical protein